MLRYIFSTVLVGVAILANAESAVIGRQVDFELANENGQFVKLSDLSAKPTLVNFWRYDCPPCQNELPFLAKIAQEGKVRVITVALHRPSQNLNLPPAINKVFTLPLLALYAPSQSQGLLNRFGNNTGVIPYSVLLSQNRVIKSVRFGEVDAIWLHKNQ